MLRHAALDVTYFLNQKRTMRLNMGFCAIYLLGPKNNDVEYKESVL